MAAMRVVAIIQARMGSTRLPGKVMKDLAGDTVLARVVERVRRASEIEAVVIATTHQTADDSIVDECRRLKVRVFRGEVNDVLDRYYHAAKEVRAEAIVRITSDCPLIEPEITDKTVRAFLEQRPDYASNVLKRTYPRGLDTEIMSWEALDRSWREAEEPYQREHVTPYIYENADQFALHSVFGETDYSALRWTLDEPEDLAFLRAVYKRMENDRFSWRDVLALLDREPGLIELNRHVSQKALHQS
jgi:spore coat polysaccharide biosynthesis protein SpsF